MLLHLFCNGVYKSAVSHFNKLSFNKKRDLFKIGQFPRGRSPLIFLKIPYFEVTCLDFQKMTRLGCVYEKIAISSKFK